MICLPNSTLWPGGETRLYLGYAYHFFSSSPPLKYLRQNADLLDLTVADISKQFTTLLTTYGGCSADPAQGDIKKFSGLFSSIRKLKITDNAAIINALNLNPVPVDDKADGARAGDYVASDLLELIVFIRKRMIELTFDDVSFSPDGKTPSRKITVILMFDNNQKASRLFVRQ